MVDGGAELGGRVTTEAQEVAIGTGMSRVDMHVTWDVGIPTGDGVVLRANIFRPSGSEPVPVIVNMGPYGKDVPLSVHYPEVWAQLAATPGGILSGSSGRFVVWEVPDPEQWVPAGYALVQVDARGTGRSPGVWSPMSVKETDDYVEAVEWLAAQPWCSGRVGVLGVSYHAMAAWRLAQRAPQHLSAIIPWHGAGDAYREAWRHGGILSNTFIDVWWRHCALNQHGSPEGTISPFTGQSTTGSERLDLAELEQRRVDLPELARDHRLLDGWSLAYAVDWSRVRVPFLSVAGLGTVGLHLRGNIEAFRHAASTQKWLMLLASEGSGIDRFHNEAGVALQRRFFDHFLRGVDNGWLSQPAVTYEIREPDGSRRAATSSRWPPAGAQQTSLYLDLHRRTLSTNSPNRTSSTSYWPTSGGITLRSEPFARRTEIVGPLALSMAVSTEARDVDLFVTVSVLDAGGRRVGPTAARGWLRLSQRLLDDGASTPDAPVHTHDRIADVAPGRRYRADVELWPTSVAVPRGGRLLLTVQGADPADANAFRHDDPDDRPSAVFAGWTSLHTDPEQPATLLLPASEAVQ